MTRRLLIVFGVVPVSDPFPYIPCHIVELVAIRRIGPDGSRAVTGIVVCVAWINVISPGIELPLKATACGFFPFGFGRQTATSPFTICLSIAPADEHDGMLPSSRWISVLFPIPIV